MFGIVSFRGRARVLLAATGAVSCFTANAELLIEHSIGVGANTSTLIIDFGYLNGDAYQFEYSYDGTATAENMLLALDAQTELAVQYQVFTFSGQSSIYVDGFSYKGNSSFPVYQGSQGEAWSYWTLDSIADSYTTTHPTGPSGRTLADGSVDAWTLNVSPYNTLGFTATNTPPAYTPEPTSLALLAVGGLAAIRRRR